jgi:hypothetical protein
MNCKALIVLAAAVVISSTAPAAEIYKWVDEDGNVHYVDRPTGNPTEERLDILSRRTSNSAVRAAVQTRLDRQATRREAQEEADRAAQAAADAEAEREKRREQCQMFRARMETYLQSRRLYRENEAGERVYLDETETLEARAKVQEKIQEFCD